MTNRLSPRLMKPLAILAFALISYLIVPTAKAATMATAALASPSTANTASTSLSSADARQLLSVLNDPAKLAALKTTLSNLQKAVAATPGVKAPLGLPQDSLGAQVVQSLDVLGDGFAAQGREVGQTLRVFGDARPWAKAILSDPVRRSQILHALLTLALVLGMAFAVSALLDVAKRRPIAVLSRLAATWLPSRQIPPPADEPAAAPNPEAGPEAKSDAVEESHTRARHLVDFARMLHALRILPLAIAHFVLELVSIAGFALAAFMFEVSGLVQSPQNLVIVQSAISAFVIGGVLMAFIYGLFAPEIPALRLVLVRDTVAKRIAFFLWLMVVIGASGFAILNVLEKWGLPDYAGSVAEKLLALAEHTLLAVLIFRSRADIANSLRPRRDRLSASFFLLRGLINNLWIIAIFFDFALWLIWAAQLKNGYARLLASTGETALVLLIARLLIVAVLGGLERVFRRTEDASGQPAVSKRAAHYYPVARRLAVYALLVAAMVAVLQAWGVDAFRWFRAGAIGGRLLSAIGGALVAIIAGVVAWEAANIGMERHIERLRHDIGGGAARVARAQTLMPILRIILFSFIAIVLVMTILSEIGVDIAPLLGGAGIVGVAIGFGSQKLVQDFITGIFLLLENAMQVGDWVTCAGLSGAVEHLSIRTIHLRAGDGSLQIIPFSSVTTVTNTNRGLGNAPVSVNIAPEEDPDQVADILKKIVTEMRADPAFSAGMLSDLQYWGVDSVTTQAVTLVGQIVCTDAARYGVQREFNRRMKKDFNARGIKLAQPVQTVQLSRIAGILEEAQPPQPSPGKDRPSAVVKDSPPAAALGHGA